MLKEYQQNTSYNGESQTIFHENDSQPPSILHSGRELQHIQMALCNVHYCIGRDCEGCTAILNTEFKLFARC